MLSKNIDLNGIAKVNLTLKHLIKLGGINTRKIVEDNLETLIKKFVDKKNFKYETTKLSYIQFFYVVLKSAPTIFYSYFTQNNNSKAVPSFSSKSIIILFTLFIYTKYLNFLIRHFYL